jgi:membrane protease YdiL (CAAX protease family)
LNAPLEEPGLASWLALAMGACLAVLGFAGIGLGLRRREGELGGGLASRLGGVHWSGLDFVLLLLTHFLLQAAGAVVGILGQRLALARFRELLSDPGLEAAWRLVSRSVLQAHGGEGPTVESYIALVAAVPMACPVVVLTLWTLGRRGGSALALLGLDRWPPPARLRSVLALALSSLIGILAVSFLWTLLLRQALGEPPESQAPVRLFAGAVTRLDVAALVVLALAAVVVAPLVEELLFRGVLYPWLRRRLAPGWAAVAVSALFCAVHINLAASLPVGLLSLILCAVYERSGNLHEPILIHACFNGSSLALIALHALLVGGAH